MLEDMSFKAFYLLSLPSLANPLVFLCLAPLTPLVCQTPSATCMMEARRKEVTDGLLAGRTMHGQGIGWLLSAVRMAVFAKTLHLAGTVR